MKAHENPPIIRYQLPELSSEMFVTLPTNIRSLSGVQRISTGRRFTLSGLTEADMHELYQALTARMTHPALPEPDETQLELAFEIRRVLG